MLYRDVIAIYSDIHTKHINNVGSQNVAFFNFKLGGPQNTQWALKPYILKQAHYQATDEEFGVTVTF